MMREPLLFLGNAIWLIFKEFFMNDVIKQWGIYLIVAFIITATGITISRKTEKKIWMFISLFLDVLCLIGIKIHWL